MPPVYAAPTPVVEDIAPEPAGYAASGLVGEYISPAPVGYAAPAPVVDYTAPQPAGYAAPAQNAEQPHPPRQDLTVEQRGDLMAQLIAFGDEIYDRGEDPALGELVVQLMDRLLDDDTSEIADDARATIPRLHHSGAAPLDASMSTTRTKASPHSSAALLVGTQWRPCAGPGPGLHRAVLVMDRVADEAERELAVSESLCHPWGT